MFATDFLLPMLTGVGTFAFSIVILSRFLYTKENYRPLNILLVAIGASVTVALVNTLRIPYVNMLSLYAIFIVITYIFYKGNFALRLGFTVIIMTINGLSEHIIVFLTLIINEIGIEDLHASALYYNLVGILTLIVYVALALIISKFFPRKYKSFRWGDMYLISFQVLTIVTTALQMGFAAEVHTSFAANLLLLILYTAFLAASLLVFFIYESALHKQELENQIELYQYQFEQMKNSQAIIGRIEHDIEKHLLALKLDLNNAQHHEAEQKIDALIGNLRLTKNVADSGNTDVDAIINYKATQAGEFGIRMVCDLRIPYTLHMDTTDLSIIMGNAIDNSIEACKSVAPDEREIAVSVIYDKPNLCMSVSNPYYGELKTDANGDYVTTKPKGRHGIDTGVNREIRRSY